MVFTWYVFSIYALEYWNLIGLWQNLLLEILSSVHLQTRKYFLSILWVSWCVNYTFFFFFCIRIITIISCLSNVRTFWEIKMIWKRPSSWFWHLLSKSADLTNPWGRFFQILFVSQKVRTLSAMYIPLQSILKVANIFCLSCECLDA